MKIISGLYKGRVLDGYDIKGTRPTMDRVKESLFAIIQNKLINSVVLDLFSGSGNLALEAISNGAYFIYVVDNNNIAIKTINSNISKLKLEHDKYEVINGDYIDALKKIKNSNNKIDIIFLDPPYKTDYIEKSIKLIDEYNILNDNGIIICESDSLDKIIYSNNYKEIKNKKYGDKYIVILEKI